MSNRADVNIWEMTAEEVKALRETLPEPKLKKTWCKCKNGGNFHSYPENGECLCGIYNHHVHCYCGGVLQFG